MLVRKNLMLNKEYWKALEMLCNIKKSKNKKISISKITNEALKDYIDREKESNFAFKMQMISEPMDEEEEKELLQELSNASKDELQPSRSVDL